MIATKGIYMHMDEVKKQEPRIPITSEEFIHLCSPENIMLLGIPGIKILAKIHSSTIYDDIKDLKHDDHELLEASIRRAFNREIEQEFLDSVALVLVFARSDENMRILLEEGARFTEEIKDVGHLATHAYINQRDIFNKASLRLAQDITNVMGRKYMIFSASKPSQQIKPLLKTLKINVFKEQCQKFLKSNGFGPHCDVYPISGSGRTGFAIDRGGFRSTKPVLDGNENRKTRFDRPVRTDYVFYEEESNAFWVSCAAKDAPIYKEIFAIMLGIPECFKEQKYFNLRFAIRDQLLAKLQRAADGPNSNLKRIFLRERIILVNGKKCELKIHKVSGGELCLSERIENTSYSDADSVSSLKLQFAFAEGRRRSAMVEITESSIKIGPLLSDTQVLNVLTYLEVWTPYANS